MQHTVVVSENKTVRVLTLCHKFKLWKQINWALELILRFFCEYLLSLCQKKKSTPYFLKFNVSWYNSLWNEKPDQIMNLINSLQYVQQKCIKNIYILNCNLRIKVLFSNKGTGQPNVTKAQLMTDQSKIDPNQSLWAFSRTIFLTRRWVLNKMCWVHQQLKKNTLLLLCLVTPYNAHWFIVFLKRKTRHWHKS